MAFQATEDEHGGQFGWNEEDADSMYLIEWAEGSEAQTTRPPSAIVHVNHAIGGWQYGRWEAVLDKSLSHYMIQLKTTLGDKLDKAWVVFFEIFCSN